MPAALRMPVAATAQHPAVGSGWRAGCTLSLSSHLQYDKMLHFLFKTLILVLILWPARTYAVAPCACSSCDNGGLYQAIERRARSQGSQATK
jgi:hypothetical protein